MWNYMTYKDNVMFHGTNTIGTIKSLGKTDDKTIQRKLSTEQHKHHRNPSMRNEWLSIPCCTYGTRYGANMACTYSVLRYAL